jgi:ketosteroid isomerase-like protein
MHMTIRCAHRADGYTERGEPACRMRFLMVWRKESDGVWRIAREVLSPDAPAT